MYPLRKGTIPIILIVTAQFTACQSQPPSTALVLETPVVKEASPTFLPPTTSQPTDTPQPTATLSPSPTATRIPSATPTATLTPTATPSPTPAYNLPGYYILNQCTTYTVHRGRWSTFTFTMDFCIPAVEILEDGRMHFSFLWTAHISNNLRTWTGAGTSNIALYDNLGNKYEVLDRIKPQGLKDGETVRTWAIFGKAKPGVTSFTYKDSEGSVNFDRITFQASNSQVPWIELAWYPYRLEYDDTVWEVAADSGGGVLLTHKKIPNCYLKEWPLGEPQGNLKNTLTLGGTRYEIYGRDDRVWSQREYRALGSADGRDYDPAPLFRAYLPHAASQQCAFDASAVLGTLKPQE